MGAGPNDTLGILAQVGPEPHSERGRPCARHRHYLAAAIAALLLGGRALAAETLKGEVLGGGAPIADATVTLWAAGEGAPKELGRARTDAEGRFDLGVHHTHGGDAPLYLVAQGGRATANKAGGDNPAIALMTVLGTKPPAKVVINEMTTIASVWTHNQFIEGTAIKGPPLQLKIAAGNVPSFVDLATGGWGTTIQDPLNGSQTPTMANFATLADALAGCVTQCGGCLRQRSSPPRRGRTARHRPTR